MALNHIAGHVAGFEVFDLDAYGPRRARHGEMSVTDVEETCRISSCYNLFVQGNSGARGLCLKSPCSFWWGLKKAILPRKSCRWPIDSIMSVNCGDNNDLLGW